MWICIDCNFQFGNPMLDFKTNKTNCPYCGSINIKNVK